MVAKNLTGNVAYNIDFQFLSIVTTSEAQQARIKGLFQSTGLQGLEIAVN